MIDDNHGFKKKKLFYLGFLYSYTVKCGEAKLAASC